MSCLRKRLGIAWSGMCFVLLSGGMLCGQDPAGYWCFEERSGEFAESLGDGPDAELVNMGASSWVPSDLDGDGIAALQFDGDDDVLVLDPEETIALGDGDGFTFSMWIKTENEEAGALWGLANHEEPWGMGHLGGWISEGILFADAAYIEGFEGAAFVADGEWHHIAIVLAYDTSEDVLDTFRFYVDGVLDMESTEIDLQEFWVDGQPIAGPQVGGGADDFPEGGRFDGLMDNVALYTTALSDAEIENLAGSPGDGCEEAPLNCDTSGDTTCTNIAVTPTEDGEAGVFTFTVDATDASGDDIIYSAIATEANDLAGPVEREQIGDNVIEMRLRAGDWIVEVTVDDDVFCDNEAANNRCQTDTITVLPITGELVAQWCLDEQQGNEVSEALRGLDGEILRFDEELGDELEENPIGNWAPGASEASPGAFNNFGNHIIQIGEVSEDIQLNESFTIAAWVKTSDPNAGAIFSQLPEEETGMGAQVFFITGGAPSYDVGYIDVVDADADVSDGDWHHVAVTVERDVFDTAEAVQFYVDGEPVETFGSIDFQEFGEEPLPFPTRIGAGSMFFPESGPRFNGRIDNVQFYNFPLSAEEIVDAMGSSFESCEAVPPFDCTGVLVPECPGLIFEGPDSRIEGIYTIVATGLPEDQVENVFYTFSGQQEGEEGDSFERSTFGEPSVSLKLSAGVWDITVEVTGSLFCDGPADCAPMGRLRLAPRPEELQAAFCFEDVDEDLTVDTVNGIEGSLLAEPPVEGDPPEPVEGLVSDTALLFDGVASAVIADESSPITGSESFSLSAWIQVGEDPETGEPDLYAGSIAMMGPELGESGDAPGFISWFVFEGVPMAHILFCCGDFDQFDAEVGFVADGEPHFVVLTADIDFEGDLDFVSVYVDGELIGEIEEDLAQEGAPDAWPLHIGYSTFDWPSADFPAENPDRDINHFNGIIDDFKYWSFVLDEEQVLEEFEAAPGQGCEGGLRFQRGDANSDGATDLSDGLFVLNNLFLGGPAPTCRKSADMDDLGSVELTDSVYLFNALFNGGPLPPTPFNSCGVDLTPDNLTCEAFDACP